MASTNKLRLLKNKDNNEYLGIPTYSICCHTRDFEYITEFIEHHLELGFDNIVIYDNMSKIPVVYNHPKVKIIPWNKPIVGFATYNHYLSNCSKGNQDWTAFIDEDEFINTNGIKIQDVMSKYKYFDSLGLNWRIFGDKVDEDNLNEKLTKKYLYHVPNSHEINTHIKTFCKNLSVQQFNHPHFPIFKKNKQNRDVWGNIIKQAWSQKADWNIIWLDHYHMRGFENYMLRQSRWVDILGVASQQKIINTYRDYTSITTEKLKIL